LMLVGDYKQPVYVDHGIIDPKPSPAIAAKPETSICIAGCYTAM
jgi:hypothetical protein